MMLMRCLLEVVPGERLARGPEDLLKRGPLCFETALERPRAEREPLRGARRGLLLLWLFFSLRRWFLLRRLLHHGLVVTEARTGQL